MPRWLRRRLVTRGAGPTSEPRSTTVVVSWSSVLPIFGGERGMRTRRRTEHAVIPRDKSVPDHAIVCAQSGLVETDHERGGIHASPGPRCRMARQATGVHVTHV